MRRPASIRPASVLRPSVSTVARFVMERATGLILGVKGPWVTPTYDTQN